MRSLAVVAAVLTFAGSARADDTAKADALFEEAQKLKQAGKTDEACKKFDEALGYNRNAVGTLLNVAKCKEDDGRIATAVKHYTQARDLAREHNLNEHRTAAEGRLAQITERVPRLTIDFAEELPNMKLLIDDEVFPVGGGELRLDPGSRHVVVTAPGRVPFTTDVVLIEGKQQELSVPVLARPVTVSRARRTIGMIATVSGAGLALTGAVLGYIADRDYQREFDLGSCMESSPKPVCNADGYRRTSNARQLGTTGTVVGIGGLVALTGGVILWVTAPKDNAERRVTVVPQLTNETAGLAAVGRF